MTRFIAPCGHKGTPVVGSYVHCPQCDVKRDQTMPRDTPVTADGVSWTRRELAHAAWQRAGGDSGFDDWCATRAKALIHDQWGCPPLILAMAAWNGARGRDSMVTMPPDEGAVFEEWYGELKIEIKGDRR